MTDFNITPPTELVEQWRTAPEYATVTEKITAIYMTTRRLQEIADQAANWGWDQREPEIQKARDEELEAMLAELKALHLPDGYVDRLRATRRPTPQPEPEGLPMPLPGDAEGLAEVFWAQPEPEGLTDDELEIERVARDLQWCARGWEPKAMLVGNVRASEIDNLCAAVLARYSHPTPQPPADGEVAELVAWLRKTGKLLHPDYSSSQVPYMRCAELLESQQTQPVPVSKRLPGAKDCDNRGRCWTTDHDPSLVYSPVWKMTGLPRQDLGHDFSNAYFWRNVRFWLPAHALPVPTEQDEAQ